VRVVITGGCGFLGRRVALRLMERTDLDELVLFDNATSALPLPQDRRLRLVTGDISDCATVRGLISPGTGLVFHLAAVVSGEAEADTDLGYRVNLDGTRAVLEACRALGTCPRVVFASSLAVYGGVLPPAVGDDTPLTPQTSYGTQKAIGELLVSDYSRKGFVDGRALRLPTVVVRPGRPNRAASTFASSMIREPLSGREAVCPVSPDTVMALASPRRVVDALLHAHDLPAAAFGTSRSLQLPGFSVAVGEMADAVRRAGGKRRRTQGSAGSLTR
jgi:nucleoside-diphosphate-sugar epimerase